MATTINQEQADASHHVEVRVLWNGGWDVYIVDTATMREPTAEEARQIERNRLFPTFLIKREKWLKCYFTPGLKDPDAIVKIVRHVAGGG